MGHILREGPGRITFQAVEVQKQMGLPGNILMDTPPHNTLWDLVLLAKDRTNWRALDASIQWPDYSSCIYEFVNYERKLDQR